MESSGSIHPLLMERPRSSGVDAEAFSFAKPASHRKPFSLRKLPNTTPLSQSANNDAQPSKQQTEDEGGFNGQLAQLEAAPKSRNLEDEATFNFQASARTSFPFQPLRRVSMSQELPKGSGGLPGTAKSQTADRSSLQFEQAPMPPPPSQIIRAEDTENTHPAESNVPFLDSSPIPLTGNANKAINIQPEPSRPTQGAEEMSNNAVLHMRPKSVDNQPRVPEQFHTKQKRTLPKRLTPSVAKQIGIQLGEDDLFELLILKMRDREVNEQKTASIQRQTEIENFSQKAEIRSLYDRLELCQAQLVKSSSETKLQRGQLDKWKVRLNKFKDVINDLGLEYDAVRDQTNDLKSITSSLQKEKADIQQALDDIRLQVAHHTNTIEIQRSKLSNFDGTISMLREALESSDRREETIKLQLAHEKRRVMTLESYIQNESQSQARCLTTVRKTQIEMVEKLEFTCGLFASTCSDSRDAITSTIRPVFEQYVSSVHEFKEQFCVQRRDVEKLTGGIQEATTRIDTLAVQLARDIETNTNASDCLSQKFQQGLQTIEGSLGPDSSLCKQLSSTESRYRHFQESLAAVEPTIGSINTSVKAIRATETDLVQGLEIFGQRLAEAQIPAGNTALEKEALTKFTENTQLQLELQKASIDLESLRKQLSNRVSENEHLQHALTEALTNEQASTSKNSRLCIENTALRGEIQLVEQNVREDFSIASTKSQDRLKADFDRKLKGLETANAKLQANSDQLKSQLVKYQGLLAEKEKTAETERLVKATTHEQYERQIEELNATCSKYITEGKAKDVAVQYWKGSGAELQAEKERLLGELEQAEEKNRRVQKSLIRKEEIDIERLEMSQSVEKRVKALELKLAEKAEELEVNLALKTKLESQTLKDTQEAEEKIKALELVTSQKTEELAKMKDSFEMMKSRAEEVGEEADSEVVVLLRRAQEAESWQATIREGFARIIEMHSDEPFEQTWQKVENILQSSPNQRLIANVLSSANLPGSAQLDTSGKKRHILGPREDGEDEVLEVDQQTERICETIANSLTDLPLSQRIFNASKLLTRESVDWLPKVPVDVRDIVPFASIHDELSREDSLSSFNDPAELEMLLISTPDLEGPADAHNSPKASQGQKESSVNPSTIGQNVSGINTAMGKRMRKADGCNSERSNTVPMKFGDPFVDKTMKSEQSNPKRKVVSFEGPNDVDQAETGRSRRMSDSIDNSSGKEAEDKAPKRTQKRTYSRLRQSVAQEETSIDRIAQPIDNPVAAKPQVPIQPIKSDTEPTKPMKMARLSDPGPGRRLSPKGLASGSSKAKATATRARTKRTTRGDRYNQRFSKNA